jgi:hypothetical protein
MHRTVLSGLNNYSFHSSNKLAGRCVASLLVQMAIDRIC